MSKVLLNAIQNVKCSTITMILMISKPFYSAFFFMEAVGNCNS